MIVQNTLIKNVQVHVSMYACMYIRMYTPALLYVYVCMNVYIYMYVCMFLYTYTQIFTPVHKRTDMNGFSPVLVKLKTCYSSSSP